MRKIEFYIINLPDVIAGCYDEQKENLVSKDEGRYEA